MTTNKEMTIDVVVANDDILAFYVKNTSFGKWMCDCWGADNLICYLLNEEFDNLIDIESIQEMSVFNSGMVEYNETDDGMDDLLPSFLEANRNGDIEELLPRPVNDIENDIEYEEFIDSDILESHIESRKSFIKNELAQIRENTVFDLIINNVLLFKNELKVSNMYRYTAFLEYFGYENQLVYQATTKLDTSIFINVESNKVEKLAIAPDEDFGRLITDLDNSHFNIFPKEQKCFSSFKDFLLFALTVAINKEMKLKQCGDKDCRKYFSAYNRSNSKYCKRVYFRKDVGRDMSCQEYAKYLNKMDANKQATTRLYGLIYRRLYARWKNDNIPTTKIQAKKNFDMFTKQSGDLKKKLKSEKISEQDYMDFLTEWDKK